MEDTVNILSSEWDLRTQLDFPVLRCVTHKDLLLDFYLFFSQFIIAAFLVDVAR